MFLKRLRGLGFIALGRLDRVGVSFSGTVASFASRNVGLAGNGYLGMDRVFILDELRLMARPALVDAGVVSRTAFKKLRGYRCAIGGLGQFLRMRGKAQSHDEQGYCQRLK